MLIPSYNLSTDRRVKVFVNDTAVSASTAESEYSRFPNFKGNFSVVENTVGDIKTYDIEGLGYVIPQEGGVAQGTANRPLNFNDSHFDIAETSGSPGSYDITSTGWVKVNALAVAPLNIANATNNEAVTVASGTNITNLTFNNDETNIYSNGTLVGIGPRAPNFSSTDFTLTDDSANDMVNIALSGGYLPNPVTGKKYGLAMGGQQDFNSPFGDGLFNLKYTGSNGSISSINSNTHGHARRYKTGGTDNDLIGVETGFDLTQLSYNPHIYGKFSMATLGQSRFFLGFHTGDIPTGSNTYLNNLVG